jgi:hypothetical protein
MAQAKAKRASVAKQVAEVDEIALAIDAMFDGREFCEAEQLAHTLGRTGKVLRAHLRSKHTRALDQKNNRWQITRDIADECRVWSKTAKQIAVKQ